MLPPLPMSLTPNNLETVSYVNDPNPAPQAGAATPAARPAQTVAAPSFAWGIVGGVAGTIVGAFVYAAFMELTHRRTSLLSIAVAYLVAKGIMMASRSNGGFQYQVTAVVMTCVAVAVGNAVMLYIDISQKQSIDPSFHNLAVLLKIGAADPIFRFHTSALLGIAALIFLFVGLRWAWRMTSEDPEVRSHPFTRWK